MQAYANRAYKPSAYLKKNGVAVPVTAEDVVLLLHGEGVQGANVITDDSTYHRTPTLAGTVLPFTDSAQVALGTRSIRFTASGDSHLYYQHGDFAVGADDFVIDFRHRALAATSQMIFVAQTAAGGAVTNYSYGVFWGGSTDTKYYFFMYTATSFYQIVSASGYAHGSWRAVRCMRRGTDMELYVAGILVASMTIPDSFAPNWNSDMRFTMGRSPSGTAYNVEGWIDEFRMVKRLSYPTGTYTVDTSPFPNP